MTNVVVLMGNLVADPEMRVTTSGKSVASFRIANNRRYGDTEKTTYADCTAFSGTADFVDEYMEKGSRVVVTGRLEMREWEDKDTHKNRQKLEIICDRVDFAGSKPKEDSTPQGRSSRPRNRR